MTTGLYISKTKLTVLIDSCLIVDFVDIKKALEEYNKKRNLDVDLV
jgi:hypothetical protein